jgi:hypothetical protein
MTSTHFQLNALLPYHLCPPHLRPAQPHGSALPRKIIQRPSKSIQPNGKQSRSHKFTLIHFNSSSCRLYDPTRTSSGTSSGSTTLEIEHGIGEFLETKRISSQELKAKRFSLQPAQQLYQQGCFVVGHHVPVKASRSWPLLLGTVPQQQIILLQSYSVFNTLLQIASAVRGDKAASCRLLQAQGVQRKVNSSLRNFVSHLGAKKKPFCKTFEIR